MCPCKGVSTGQYFQNVPTRPTSILAGLSSGLHSCTGAANYYIVLLTKVKTCPFSSCLSKRSDITRLIEFKACNHSPMHLQVWTSILYEITSMESAATTGKHAEPSFMTSMLTAHILTRTTEDISSIVIDGDSNDSHQKPRQKLSLSLCPIPEAKSLTYWLIFML